MYDIEFAGITGRAAGVKVTQRPAVPSPRRRYNSTIVPGRAGSLIELDEYEDIEIPVKMNFVTSPEVWGTQFRNVKKWLLGKSGRLVLSDDPGCFYRVKMVAINDTEREVREGGTFTAIFLCDPYTYMAEGREEQNMESASYNPYETSCPIYRIAGEGVCTLTVNGKSMTANVGQNITIDTGLMIAYREDGTIQNTEVKGDYEDLYLQEGENEIQITDGFALSIIPNWRHI